MPIIVKVELWKNRERVSMHAVGKKAAVNLMADSLDDKRVRSVSCHYAGTGRCFASGRNTYQTTADINNC